MNKSIKGALLALPLISALLLSTQPGSGQGQSTIKLQKSTRVKTTQASHKKVEQPSGQALVHHPDISVLPRSDGKKSTAPATAQSQTSEAESLAILTSCNWTLLLLEEVGAYELVINAPCPLCPIPTELTHSNSSILGFSLSPNGPWTEDLTVMTNLNASGQGVSETFYVKGETVGASTIHADSLFSQFDIEFHVVACACPEIPIVP
jgi:hypothetical protein